MRTRIHVNSIIGVGLALGASACTKGPEKDREPVQPVNPVVADAGVGAGGGREVGRVAPMDAQVEAIDVAGDNSRRNEDVDVELDAFDQGSSARDVEITRTVRDAVTDDDSLSTYAHNVKIITRDGRVVLRGPVRSAAEKAKVEAVARRVAGAPNVTSDLVVTP